MKSIVLNCSKPLLSVLAVVVFQFSNSSLAAPGIVNPCPPKPAGIESVTRNVYLLPGTCEKTITGDYKLICHAKCQVAKYDYTLAVCPDPETDPSAWWICDPQQPAGPPKELSMDTEYSGGFSSAQCQQFISYCKNVAAIKTIYDGWTKLCTSYTTKLGCAYGELESSGKPGSGY